MSCIPYKRLLIALSVVQDFGHVIQWPIPIVFVYAGECVGIKVYVKCQSRPRSIHIAADKGNIKTFLLFNHTL